MRLNRVWWALGETGRHADLDLASLQLFLGGQPGGSGKAAVMGNHRLFSHALGKLMGNSLHQTPGVDEDQSGAMTPYQIRYRV